MEDRPKEGQNRRRNVNRNARNVHSTNYSAPYSLQIFYTNADSLHNKIDELKLRVSTLQPDIIIITEAMPKAKDSGVSHKELSIKGYNLTYNNQEGGRGIVIYTGLHLVFKEVILGNIYKEHQIISIELKNKENLIIGAIYRSPSAGWENNDELCELLTNISNLPKTQGLVIGDFNYPKIDWKKKEATGTNSQQAQKFLDTIEDIFWTQHVDTPTRARSTQEPSLLDLLITSNPDMISNLEYRSPLGKSDHSVLTFTVATSESITPKIKPKPAFDKANYIKMKQLLENDWREAFDETYQDANSQWEIFYHRLKKAEDECVPLKMANPRKKARYVDRDTLQLVKKKRRAWTRYIETREEEKYNKFIQLRNLVRNRTRNQRVKHEMDVAKEVKSNPKRFWQHINSVTKFRQSIPSLKAPDGQIVENDKAKAELLGKFFTSVFVKEDQTNIPSPEAEPRRTSLTEVDLTENRIKKQLKSLKVNKSAGPDQVYPRVLKELADVIAGPLSTIFTTSFNTGKLPNIWKIGNICAIFKKGSKQDCNNYRPVSLTSIACKVMESIIRDDIMSYMTRNNLFSNKQYGFLPHRSTVQQLLKILDDWTEALDDDTTLEAIYMDFQKAFDTVPHDRLLKKLHNYGIRGPLHSWIKDFLKGRSQKVVINNDHSTPLPVDSGVPQGSVLGPVLFVIFINDLPDNIKSQIYLFADDTKLYRRIEGGPYEDHVQQDLTKLQNWSNKWLLKFHPDKCKRIFIHKSQNELRTNPLYLEKTSNANSTEKAYLETVKAHKDLGIIIDDKLSFEDHINSIVNKANQMMGIINRNFKYLEKEVFLPLYTTLVRSRLEYGQAIWSPHLKKHIRKIEAVQRRATKKVPSLKKLSYPERLKALNLPTLSYRRLRGDMIEVYKISHEIYDPTTSIQLPFRQTNRRGHDRTIFQIRALGDIRKFSFKFRVAKPWNDLPQEVVSAPSLNAFKRRLDKEWTNHPLKFNPV